MGLAFGRLADNLDLADPRESVFLDNQPGFLILKVLVFLQPLTSIQKVPHEETSQNVQALLLMGRFPFCREILNSTLEKPNPSQGGDGKPRV